MPKPSSFQFGPFEYDAIARELRRGGTRLKVQDQPLQILHALLERPGELVTREELRNRLWPSDTFVDFDHSLNSAIRKLREALGDDADSPRYIETLPRRGYRFLAPLAPVAVPIAPPAPRLSVGPQLTIALLAVTGLGALWIGQPRPAPPQARLAPVTTLAGVESGAAFSPDGRQMVFSWNGEKRDNFDLYVKLIGEPNSLRLTTHASADSYAAWSPDGSQIAFVRRSRDGGVFLISPLGGAERKLADTVTTSKLSWHPNGKSILISSLYDEATPAPGAGSLVLIPIGDARQTRTILSPPPGKWYRDGAISPDAGSLAYASCEGPQDGRRCTILVTSLNADVVPVGTPRVIAPASSATYGIAWTPDSQSLVYANVGADAMSQLWRRELREGAESIRIELAGTQSHQPTIDATGKRLAFSRSMARGQIWRFDAAGGSAPFISSSTRDHSPQFSPDGRRIAFASARHEHMAIWTANADGTSPTQITHLQNPFAGTPRWSPDGRFLTFDSSRGNSGWKIWIVEANGNAPRQLTDGPGDDAAPSWSSDGQWIFFGSKRSGRFEIWRVAAKGGPPEQVTRNGGYAAFTSADGKSLYYTRTALGADGLWTKPLPDGEERQLIAEAVTGRGFVPFPDTIYYLHCKEERDCHIRSFEFSSGRSRNLADFRGPVYLGLTVSPNRKEILFAKIPDPEQDILLIENFR